MQATGSAARLIFCTFAIIGLLKSHAFSDDGREMAKYYESCIIKEIKKCESKVDLVSGSTSEKLQDYARIKARKAEFLRADKDILIEEMIEIQIEPKPYKIELFLNRKFQSRREN